MKREELTVVSNARVSDSVWEMRLGGGVNPHAPGQFVDVALDGLFLRRPISVCDWTPESLTLLYKVVGKGTAKMSEMLPGESLDVLTGLGNGFDLSAPTERPLLVGGGIGVAPLYYLAKKLVEAGKSVSVILGFNKADEIIYVEEFRSLGVKVVVATADGSVGVKGFVTDALGEVPGYDFFYACGPMPMLRALEGRVATDGQVSLEERMGCGTGICMGCTCRTMLGAKRVCKDGPVFYRRDIVW